MKNLLIMLAFVFSLLLIPVQALAVDFTIEETRIDAFLQENGDVQVKEQHTYEFDGDFNGITRTLIPKEDTDIQNVKAFEDNKPLKVDQEGNLYKIYRGGSDERITIDLSYTIQNGMDVYSDLGQFYWPFFDSGNESTYENMDIYVHPPQPTDGVYAIGYDEAEGSDSISADGIVHFALGEVDSGEKGDIRAAYDSSLFPGAVTIEGETIRGEIQDEVAAYEERLEAFNDRKDTLSKLAPFVIVIFAVYLTALLVSAWRRKRATLWEVQRQAGHHSHLPEKQMSLPATILHMKHMAADGNLLSAALLDLVRKGFVARKNENEFVVSEHTTDHPHEKVLIQWLFYKVGKDGVFTVDALDEYVEDKENQQSYHEKFTQWVEAVKTEIKQHSLVDKKAGLRWTVAISGLLLIPFTILFGVHDLLMWMFFSLLLAISLLLFALIYQPRTVEGARLKYQWNNFSSNYHSIDSERWSEWMSDDQMQAFIYAIGMNDKNMLDKNEKLAGKKSPGHDSFTTSSSDLVMLMIISGTITNRFNSADQTVSAGTGGSSIPGGGSGVGGGGGGSGAF
ncbi:DUF2207 domain-containing protein [Bacillus salacetis]|uniref:DUF2207 domain-containing protein n=1 Tax=Bacillus salacetis TaxID=2315464 RepID=A0A3A1QQU9_9BACI|nr:DUF2207 domain-containing protein [Bacillus salacetis]RIW28666.1 DUF2207 domain-containing protein [Bacillus salacetis]